MCIFVSLYVEEKRNIKTIDLLKEGEPRRENEVEVILFPK